MPNSDDLPSRVWPLPRIETLSLRDVHEERPVALYTSGPAWDALGGVLDLPVAWRAEPVDATEELFADLALAIPTEAEVVYAVGGGLSVDAAKIGMVRHGVSLIAVPTALSVDAHFTPASGIRHNGCVFYLETGAPERLLVDWDVIAAAPPWVRAAGLGDILSIATGLWDWRYAEERGENSRGQEWIPYVAEMAQILLHEGIGVVVTFEHAWILPPSQPMVYDFKVELLGSEGAVYVDSSHHGAFELHAGGRMSYGDVLGSKPTSDLRAGGFVMEAITRFADAVLHDRPILATGEVGVEATRIVDAIKRSAETGQPVDV